MAVTIQISKPVYNVATPIPDMTSVNGEGIIPYKGGRGGILITLFSIENGSVTVKGGSGVFGGGDKTVTIESGKNMHLLLEPGPYLQTEGDYKGCVVVESNNCMLSAVELN